MHCRLSNGIEAVVKYRNNQQGSITLVNELISNNLAKLFGIQSLDFGICTLADSASIGAIIDQQLFTLIPDVCGPAFYVEYVRNIRPFSRSAIHRYNHTQWAKMILFDHVVYNKDRHEGNILLTNDCSGNIFPIDYTHVFKNQCIWDQYTFRQGIAGDDYTDRCILERNEEVYKPIYISSCPCINDFEQSLKDIPNLLTDEVIHSIMDTLPPVWLEDAYITEQDLSSLREYLLYRISHIEDLVELIVAEGRNDS